MSRRSSNGKSSSMKIITVKLLKSNSEVNKDMLTFLKSSLSSIVQNNFKYEFKYAKSDGKTVYPQININNKNYVGLSQIRTMITKLINATVQQNKELIDTEADIHSYQLKDLMRGDDGDEGFGDEIKDDEIQKKANQFNKHRTQRSGANDNDSDDDNVDINANRSVGNAHIANDTPVAISHSASQDSSNKKHSSADTHVRKSKSKSKPRSSHIPQPQSGGGKRPRVLEEAGGDIGESFAELGGKNQDDMMLNNMFANMEESPGS